MRGLLNKEQACGEEANDQAKMALNKVNFMREQMTRLKEKLRDAEKQVESGKIQIGQMMTQLQQMHA